MFRVFLALDPDISRRVVEQMIAACGCNWNPHDLNTPSEFVRCHPGCFCPLNCAQRDEDEIISNDYNILLALLAETEGFEPSIELYNPITV
jgi:hypothetical protein